MTVSIIYYALWIEAHQVLMPQASTCHAYGSIRHCQQQAFGKLYKSPSVPTRQYHQYRFSRVSTSTDTYKYSFIPNTITDWNRLPQGIIQAPSTDVFRAGVWEYLLQCGNLIFNLYSTGCLFNFNCKCSNCVGWLMHTLLTVSAKWMFRLQITYVDVDRELSVMYFLDRMSIYVFRW